MTLTFRKVGVIGSRQFTDYALLKSVLDNSINPEDIIISGGAVGADSMAQRWAKENGHSIHIHYPNYKRFGRGATFVRNKVIAEESDLIIAFYVPERFGEGGTAHTVNEAKKLNKKVIEI